MMKFLATTLSIIFSSLASTYLSFGQGTYTQVYNILTSGTCGSSDIACHNGTTASGLDFNVTASELYNSIYLQDPQNIVSAQKGNKLVYPGDPYRSFLFRKINHGLAANVDLTTGEGDLMPLAGNNLNVREAELIRQWILFGAPDTGTVISEQLIDDYYSGMGMESVTNPPQPPELGSGFQIHVGPFLLAPGEENATEMSGGQFMRYDAPIESEAYVTKIESYSGFGQHHYTLLSTGNTNMPYGLADASPWFFQETKFLASAQRSIDTLFLPEGTGISIDIEHPLVANIHFFNPSNAVLACDYYLNIYTSHIQSGLEEIIFGDVSYVNNPDMGPFFIPNDGQPHTFEYAHEFSSPQETRYIWALMAHSHGYTTENNIYLRNPNGSKGDIIYDGGCPGGIPCNNSEFDDEHVPTRYFTDGFLALDMSEGLIQSATYVNNSNQNLEYGPFAEDSEMMVMGYYYLLDTTGIIAPNVSINEPLKEEFEVNIYPNPTYEQINISLKSSNALQQLRVMDNLGRSIHLASKTEIENGKIKLNKGMLGGKGIYFVEIFYANNKKIVRKIVVF